MNGLAAYYVSTIEKPHEYFDLTTKFLIYGLFQKGRVLAQDGVAYRRASTASAGLREF